MGFNKPLYIEKLSEGNNFPPRLMLLDLDSHEPISFGCDFFLLVCVFIKSLELDFDNKIQKTILELN